MNKGTIPSFLSALFVQLRRRHFILGPDNYNDLILAMKAGFGWSSKKALRNLLCSLWAKSLSEQETLGRLFDQITESFEILDWDLSEIIPDATQKLSATESNEDLLSSSAINVDSIFQDQTSKPAIIPDPVDSHGLPPIPEDEIWNLNNHFIFMPEYPIAYREIAQAWRRLRQPLREGPPVELDISATLHRRTKVGVPSSVVLVPRRRNSAKLLLLVDRRGSMKPFHKFIDTVCAAICNSGNLKQIALFFFHDVPSIGADENLILSLGDDSSLSLDHILGDIPPLQQGVLFTHSSLQTSPQFPTTEVAKVLRDYASEASIVIISDGGSARAHYDRLRLLDTVAFLKALYQFSRKVVWLNPTPESDWQNTTAEQIARYVPMLPMDRYSMYTAVDVLRGRPFHVEKPM